MIRRHPITGAEILFAPGRAERPGAFVEKAERCPFCPGHEDDTPPAIVTLGEPWRARVFPNKYPSVDGAEVIVESARHDDTFATIDDAASIVRLWIDRYRAHDGAAHVQLFKNHGPGAGATLEHMHSQLMPVPFVPPRIRAEQAALGDATNCPLCKRPDAELVIEETAAFWRYAPYGSSFAYQQWIVPKTHEPDFTNTDAAELAAHLRNAAWGDSYNWLLMNFRERGHWYVDVIPRGTTIAGFELATGTFVEIIDPAAAARRLRN